MRRRSRRSRSVLAKDDSKVDVQVEAAMTYQLWAAEPKQALKYKNAIDGAELDPVSQKKIVWGWNRIAAATAPLQGLSRDPPSGPLQRRRLLLRIRDANCAPRPIGRST